MALHGQTRKSGRQSGPAARRDAYADQWLTWNEKAASTHQEGGRESPKRADPATWEQKVRGPIGGDGKGPAGHAEEAEKADNWS